jgi:hypothetical protein
MFGQLAKVGADSVLAADCTRPEIRVKRCRAGVIETKFRGGIKQWKNKETVNNEDCEILSKAIRESTGAGDLKALMRSGVLRNESLARR